MNDLTESLQALEELPLRYTEDDYTAYCDLVSEFTEPQLISYFGRLRYRQMDRRYRSETCRNCDVHTFDELTDRLCAKCRALPVDECADPKSGQAWAINR